MRYAQRGGYTPIEQQRRERLRMEAAGRFARGDEIGEIARDLRATEGSVQRWHRAWRDGGTEAPRSRRPVSRERLSPQQWARLEAELRKGPLAHGFANDQRWTLGRIKTLIGKLFHVGYTIEGTSKLMRRHGWSAQVPVRQALERDDAAVAEGIWSLLKRSMANFAAADLEGLVRIVKRKLEKIQYRPHLIDGCLAGTGLTLEPWRLMQNPPKPRRPQPVSAGQRAS